MIYYGNLAEYMKPLEKMCNGENYNLYIVISILLVIVVIIILIFRAKFRPRGEPVRYKLAKQPHQSFIQKICCHQPPLHNDKEKLVLEPVVNCNYLNID